MSAILEMEAPAKPRMEVDVLSQVAEAFRLKGSFSGVFALSPPWGFSIPKNDRAGLLMVTRGRIYFESDGAGGDALELAAGDVVALPHGGRHSLRDDLSTPLKSAAEMGACS